LLKAAISGLGFFALSAHAQTTPVTSGSDSAQTPIATTSAQTSQDAVTEIDKIVVTGRAQKLYRVPTTTVGKLPIEPLASSQMVTALTGDLIQDQGARNAQDLYRNISGVSVYSYAGVTARGFNQEENFYDGLRGDPYNGFSVPQLFNMERVEFLKGPAGMLYGQAAPGGIFNYVTKKPKFRREGSLRGVAGSGSRAGATIDATGPVTQTIALRGGIFHEQRDLPRNNADSRVLIADGGASVNLGFGMLTGQVSRIESDLGANRLRGVPVNDEGSFLTDRRWNGNEKEDFLRLNSDSAQLRLEGEVTQNLIFDAGLRYIDAEERQEYHNPSALIDASGKQVNETNTNQPVRIVREFRRQFRNNKIWSFGTNAVWSTELSETVSNRVLFGMDWYSEKAYEHAALASGTATSTADDRLPTPLDLHNPIYGQTNRADYEMSVKNPGTLTDSRRTGLYVLNELTIDKFILTAGVRRDSFRDTVTVAADGLEDEFSDSVLTYRGGLVYRATENLSFFGQYATSFEPQEATNQRRVAGGPFDPTQGDMWEAGFKASLLDARLQPAVALYRITRSNVLQPRASDAPGGSDPGNDGTDDFVALGEVTSEGVDVDLATDITPNWVATLTYAYNKTRVTSDNGKQGVGDQGDRFANAPKNKFGFWTRYQIPSSGFAFAVGGDYVSERINRDGQRVKPYLVFDASVIYQAGPWKTLLRIDNLFDKTYAASGFTRNAGHFPGAPRSAFIELSREF